MSDTDDDCFIMSNDDEESDFDIENIEPNKSSKRSNAKKSAKSAKVTKAPKKPKTAVKKSAGKSAKTKKKKEPTIDEHSLDDSEDIVDVDMEDHVSSNQRKIKETKSVEEIYQKKSQLEHILLRPDTYVGSVEPIRQSMFILDPTTTQIKMKEITYTPGLFKIFDEIIVNAADNKQRDPKMDLIAVEINGPENRISVLNNGNGIPVVVHKDEDCYVPTMIFGQLLTGSNFDDDEKKTTGGRNGYGAKLANIFSNEFIIECKDVTRGLKFEQRFRNNMSVEEEPLVTKLSTSEKKGGDTTKITFSPDLARFQMNELDADTIGLLSKRAYDIAGSLANRGGKRLAVTLNNEKLPIKSFESYLKIYDGISLPIAYEKINDRWEVGIGVSEGSFQQVSFVNSICTSKGGGHTEYISNQVTSSLVSVVKKKSKGSSEVKKNQIANHICVFVNCLIENPTFDSQTKEFLTSRPKAFGSECNLSSTFLSKIAKSEIVDNVLEFAKFKDRQALKRQGGKKKTKLTGIAKLDDANFAGSSKSVDCTLIVTEGDSAKSLAMSGLSVVGRDYYGVFPLKGKPLNVRDATIAQVSKNEEIKYVVDILGLKYGVEYDEQNIKSLRYGHLMIMADQDHDGSHIKGLLINLIHHFWPSLLDVKGFLKQFITPIVKATKKDTMYQFFTLPQYEEWYESIGQRAKGYTIKYYKGLGTSTSAEAKEYFSNLEIHEIPFSNLQSDVFQPSNSDSCSDEESISPIPECVKSGSDLIEMAFKKSRVEDRKVWLNSFKQGTHINYNEAHESGIRFSDFINKELILFSQEDNQRSIPHIFDGFKPSQRKVLFSCIKRNLTKEIKVAQLAGYISEHSAYHHGENSLNQTIVNMAQNYVGSNNINLLTPSGQFGTRRLGGKDAASPRYIFTKLENITRTIFHPDDDELLDYLNDDGMSIEPKYYMPVIPMILVNGSDGIGTGWSTFIPNYCPRQIIQNLRRLISGEQMEKLKPFYYGFDGQICAESKIGQYSVRGEITRIDDTTVHITELPVKTWTQNYKVFLESLLLSDKSEPDLKDFTEAHTDAKVSFTITSSKEKIDEFEKSTQGLIGKFKLASKISTTNMNVFNAENQIVKYHNPEDIILAFYRVRLEYYNKRKDHLLRIMRRELGILSNKARFVLEVCRGELIINNRKRKDILLDLQNRGYDMYEKKKKKLQNDDPNSGSDSEGMHGTTRDAELARGYDYLLSMKIWTLTYEKVEQLKNQKEEKQKTVLDLEAKPVSAIWEDDLDAIEEALDDRDKEFEENAKNEKKAQQKSRNDVSKRGKNASKKPKPRNNRNKNENHNTDANKNLNESNQMNALSSKLRDSLSVSSKNPAPVSSLTQSIDVFLAATSKESVEKSHKRNLPGSDNDGDSGKVSKSKPKTMNASVKESNEKMKSPKKRAKSTEQGKKTKSSRMNRKEIIVESSEDDLILEDDESDASESHYKSATAQHRQRSTRVRNNKPKYTVYDDSDDESVEILSSSDSD